jgi:histidyl-tRNA synthetase
LGAEVLGSEDPDVDVEMITLAWRFYEDLGVTRLRLDLTSLGDDQCRPAYRQKLVEYLRGQDLCPEHAGRFEDNPLRVLDCKKPECVAATGDAPFQIDNLCEPCTIHFERVKAGLDALGVPYALAPRLVRGLDYYTRTTFEFAAGALPPGQNAAGGGGRYDKLAAELGGPPTPGIGFGLGIERILLVCDAEEVFPVPRTALDVFVIDTTGGEAARNASDQLREAGVRTDRAFDNRSFKAQMTQARRSNARFALVIEDEGWSLRTLIEKGEPTPVDPPRLVDDVKKRLQE